MLWRGMTPALARHAIYTGTRMSAYEEIRDTMQKKDKDGFPMWKKVVAGMSAGGFGQFVASPTDLIKTQIQMEGKRRLQGKKARVNGMIDAFQLSQDKLSFKLSSFSVAEVHPSIIPLESKTFLYLNVEV